jgi:starch synthase
VNVLFVVAEMAPLAKVGGVGDVGAALPRALRRLGVDVRVAMPYYDIIREYFKTPLEGEGPGATQPRRIAALPDGAALWRTDVRDVPVYLIEHEPSFGRKQVYGYPDDADRFLAFADALLAAADVEGIHGEPGEPSLPEAIHLNDWHTGFLAARLAAHDHPWSVSSRLFTIHNLGYTGPYDDAFARKHGLPGAGSALVRAIENADLVTTVSPTYAREILTPEYGGELVPLLQQLGDRLVGVLNGIDTEEYDPARDPHLAATFDSATIERRVENKRALQQRLGLPVDDEVPLIAMVNRLFVQKGSDLAADAIERLLPLRDFQFAVLGTGEKKYEEQLSALAARNPDRVAARIAFDAPLGQLFYGACDMFLMPSRYEPCGLGQMIAMRYGAVPIVRLTGGLADSVSQYEPDHNRGTGFLFEEPTSEALLAALELALASYEDPPPWRALQLRAMAQDLSWDRAARRYIDLYERATERAP